MVKVLEEEKVEDEEEADIAEDIDGEEEPHGPPKKYYVDNGSVEIAAHLVYELDANGKQLRVVKFTDYTAESVRSMCPSAASLRSKWSSREERAEIIQALEERGISFDELVKAADQPDADPFALEVPMVFVHVIGTASSRHARAHWSPVRNLSALLIDASEGAQASAA